METGLWTILLTAGLTTVGTVGVTYWSHYLSRNRDDREQSRLGTFAAIRTVTALDRLVVRCCDMVGDEGVYTPDGEFHPGVEFPMFELPADVDWRSVESGLLYRIMALPNELFLARNSIQFVVDSIVGPPDLGEHYEEQSYQYGRVGLIALDLARDIRSFYKLAGPDYSRWNPRPFMEKAIEEREKRNAEGARLAQMLMVGKP
jgi:hypothetical protein